MLVDGLFQKKSALQKQRKLYNFPPLGNDESDHIMQLQHDLLWNCLNLGGAEIEIGKGSGDILSFFFKEWRYNKQVKLRNKSTLQRRCECLFLSMPIVLKKICVGEKICEGTISVNYFQGCASKHEFKENDQGQYSMNLI